MPVNDELGKRMKESYEKKSSTSLEKKIPVAIRIDGKAFHTFTRGFKKPFDLILIQSMQETMKYLCENIQGCVLGYTQSDEITLILIDYKNPNSSAWFDYKVQKMCSVAASMATMAFNRAFSDFAYSYLNGDDVFIDCIPGDNYPSYIDALGNAIDNGAMFDARCFNIPKEEVCNLIYWRQLDAIRNSIQMVGQANFSHKELQGKSCNKIQDMLMTQRGINWNDFKTYQKRGSCCIKEQYQAPNVDIKDGVCLRSRWVIDYDIPIFKNEGREYIDKLIFVGG